MNRLYILMNMDDRIGTLETQMDDITLPMKNSQAGSLFKQEAEMICS